MKKKRSDELRPEYDFAKLRGVRGKYLHKYRAGTNVVLLDPDVASVFQSPKDVNAALRSLISVARTVKTG